jgi:protein SCO1/2
MESSVASIASRWAARLAEIALAIALAIALPACASRSEGEGATELPYYSTPEFTAEWIPKEARAQRRIHTIAPFSFTDQDGREVSNATLKGKIYVADFFFTSCPSVCPKMTASFKRIQDAFQDEPGVELVSHTVDPSSDTPERLAEYARGHGIQRGKWHLVTGDQTAIYTLARTSYFAEKTAGFKRGADEFLHTENMLLVDREGHLRGVYNATLPAEATRVIEDVRALLAER